MEDFFENIKKIERGYELACKYVENEQSTHYFIQNRHIGDATRNLKLIKPFKLYYSGDSRYHFENKKGKVCKMFPKQFECKKVVVITGRVIAGVAKLFPEVDDVVILSSDELSALEAYANSGICVHTTLHPDEDRKNWLKAEMFGVPSISWNLCIPNELEKGYPVISERVVQAGIDILNRENVVPKKVLILCPYAKSSTYMSGEIWEKIILKYTEREYTIFTNVAPNEQELHGTRRLQVPVDALVGMVYQGCEMIGLQSGLVDTLVWSGLKTRMAVIIYAKRAQDLQYAYNRGVNGIQVRKNNLTYFLFRDESPEEIWDKINGYIEETELEKKEAITE